MSIKVMSAVWSSGPQNKTELLVLLALADNADDTGKCWPSYETISKKSRVTRRHVIRIINKLCNDGYLEKKQRYQTSNMYIINLEMIGGDTVSLVTDNVTRPSDIGDTPLVTSTSYKPSVNHKLEPSIPDNLNVESFLLVWEEWKQYRKEIKKPLKATSIKYQMKKLKKYTPETAAAMLVQSIENQWQGIFELKNGAGVGASSKLVRNQDGSVNV